MAVTSLLLLLLPLLPPPPLLLLLLLQCARPAPGPPVKAAAAVTLTRSTPPPVAAAAAAALAGAPPPTASPATPATSPTSTAATPPHLCSSCAQIAAKPVRIVGVCVQCFGNTTSPDNNRWPICCPGSTQYNVTGDPRGVTNTIQRGDRWSPGVAGVVPVALGGSASWWDLLFSPLM